VTAIGGWTIRPGRTSSGSTRAWGISYSVIDTLACCREVGKFYVDGGGRGRANHDRRRKAEHLCAELNALEAEYEAMHGSDG
jgi:hypothetical protein